MVTQVPTISGGKHRGVRIWLDAILGIALVCLLYCKGCTGPEWTPARIERITGIKVPEFRITYTLEGKRGFNGDYMDRLDIEFESLPSDELFKEIDKMIAAGNTEWERKGNRYSFSAIWGNGFPTPLGERAEDDGIFSITITKGENTGEIIYGAW